MISKLMHLDVPAVELVIRGACVYLFVLLVLRLGGKRQLAQMSPTEFVAVLLISNAVQNSMNGGDNSLIGGWLLALVLVIMSTAISFLTYKSKRWRRAIEGVPTLVIHHGKTVNANLHRERITVAELCVLLRHQGFKHIDEIKTAVLEPDGTLDVILAEPHSLHSQLHE